MTSEPKMEFLKPRFAEVADLPVQEGPPPQSKPRKRSRCVARESPLLNRRRRCTQMCTDMTASTWWPMTELPYIAGMQTVSGVSMN